MIDWTALVGGIARPGIGGADYHEAMLAQQAAGMTQERANELARAMTNNAAAWMLHQQNGMQNVRPPTTEEQAWLDALRRARRAKEAAEEINWPFWLWL